MSPSQAETRVLRRSSESAQVKNLKAEISSLDLEIQDLQNSLRQELSFNYSD
jgi:hypothetical protein